MMHGLKRRKFITAGIACAVVCTVVVVLDRSGVLSGLLDTSSAASAARSADTHASASISTTSQAAVSNAAVSRVVNINTAREDELVTLKGIGPTKASAIMNDRVTNGLFYKIEDIMRVKGIGRSMFENIRGNITVGNVLPPPHATTVNSTAPKSETLSTTQQSSHIPAQAAHVVITQVTTGMKGFPGYEFVELYNMGTETVDLTGWSMKKRSSSGSISTLVAGSHFSGKSIAPHSYFIAASSGYTGVSADIIWPSSYTLAGEHNAVILENNEGHIADTVAWDAIPEGESYTRTSPESNDFTIESPQPHLSR